MFFNNCNCFRNKPCCCRQEKDCNKQENRPCCNIHDKCNEDSQEKYCCHIKFENKCCWDKERDNCFDRHEEKHCHRKPERKEYCQDKSRYDCSYNKNDFNKVENQRYFTPQYFDYTKSDYRNNQNGTTLYNNYDEINNLDYNEEKNFNYNYERYYTPNWDEDRNCKHDNKNDKPEWIDNKCCKPVKFICFPWYKY